MSKVDNFLANKKPKIQSQSIETADLSNLKLSDVKKPSDLPQFQPSIPLVSTISQTNEYSKLNSFLKKEKPTNLQSQVEISNQSTSIKITTDIEISKDMVFQSKKPFFQNMDQCRYCSKLLGSETRVRCFLQHQMPVCHSCFEKIDVDNDCEECKNLRYVPPIFSTHYAYFLLSPEAIVDGEPEDNFYYYDDDDEHDIGYVLTRCLFFNKTDSKDIQVKSQFCITNANEFRAELIPHYFSAVISLSPSVHFISGGCLGYPPEFYSSRYVFAVILNKTDDPLQQSVLNWDIKFQSAMVTGRHCHKLFIVGDYLYAIGGLSKSVNKHGSSIKSCEKLFIKKLEEQLIEEVDTYDIIDIENRRIWENVANLNSSKSNFGGFVYNGCIYVFGGFSGVNMLSKTLEKYDPKNDKWELVDKNFLPIADPLCLQQGDYVYVIGGTNGSTKSKTIYKIDCKTLKCELFCTMKNERSLAQGMIQDNKLIIFGGENTITQMESINLQNRQSEIYNNETKEGYPIDYDAGIDGTGMIGVNGFFFSL